MRVFVDTGAWIALTDKTDDYHKAALKIHAYLEENNAWLITSDYIIDETITWLRYKAGHKAAVKFWSRVNNSRVTEIIDVDTEIKNSAWKTFLKYTDHELSFTDCTSFAIMKKHKLPKVFSYDSHFKVLGFQVLS